MPKGARTIVVVRKPRVDKLSSPSAAVVTAQTIDRVAILPRQTKEEGGGWITIDGWDIWILPSSIVQAIDGPRPYADGDVLPTDLIEIDGEVWSVDGRPAPYDKGTKRKGTQVKVKSAGKGVTIPSGPLAPFPAAWDGDDLLDIIEEELDG